jgi:hypothetical protein
MRVFNGRKAREFRRRILTDQGNVDICRLCSGYGHPQMTKKKPISFEVLRHSFNAEELDLSGEIEAPRHGAGGH